MLAQQRPPGGPAPDQPEVGDEDIDFSPIGPEKHLLRFG